MANFGELLMTGLGNTLGALPGATIGNLVGNLFGSLFGNQSAKKQFQYASDLQKQQFDLQQQMFDYTSAYNSPVNAVQRYKVAGLNPNLLTGQTQVAGTTGSIGQGSVGMRQVNSQLDMASAMQANLQSQKLDAEVNLMNSQTDLNKYKALTEWYNGLDAKSKSKYSDLMYRASLDLLQKQSVESSNRSELLKQQTVTETFKQYNLDANAQKAISDIMFNQVKANLSASEIELNAAKICDINSNISYRSALIKQAEAYESLLRKQGLEQDEINKIRGKEAKHWNTLTNNNIAEQTARMYNYYKSKSGLNIFGLGGSTTVTPKYRNSPDYVPIIE